MNIEWNSNTVSEIIKQHFDSLSVSDKQTLQQICTRALRKTLSVSTRKQTQPD